MTKLATILASAVAIAGITTIASIPARAETLTEKGEARLARMIEGRTAGEPVMCINAPRSTKLQVIERVGVVYDSGDTIYVARPSNANALGSNNALVIKRLGSQLCTSDMTRTFDRYNGNITGAIFFDKFVPYTKPD